MLCPRPPLTVCVGLNHKIVVELVPSQTGAVGIILPAHTCGAHGGAQPAHHHKLCGLAASRIVSCSWDPSVSCKLIQIAAIVESCRKLHQLSAAHMCMGLCWGWVRTPPTPLDPRLCMGRWRRLQSPLEGCQRTTCTAGRAGRQDFDALEPGEQLRQHTIAMAGRTDWFPIRAGSARIGAKAPPTPTPATHLNTRTRLRS